MQLVVVRSHTLHPLDTPVELELELDPELVTDPLLTVDAVDVALPVTDKLKLLPVLETTGHL